MNVLVTGGAGFVGSHVTAKLYARGWNVAVLDDLSTGSVANLRPEYAFFERDIRQDLRDVFDAVKPEVVIHLAAQVSVPVSFADPHKDMTVNTAGTLNVLQEASRARAKKLVFVSTAAVYGVPQQLPLTEDSATCPLSPYGLSKLMAEEYVRMLAPSLGLRYTILRPANIFGPRQTIVGDGAVVPSFLNQFMHGWDPVIHGDGSQTRDFIYVEDMAEAIIRAVEHGDGLTLNVSSGEAHSIRELWETLASLVRCNRPPIFGPPRVGDITHSVMANDAARRHLRWEPLTSWYEGLALTVRWARSAFALAGQRGNDECQLGR